MGSGHLDFETRSATDLLKSGVFRYAEDPTTGAWGFCYSLPDGPIQEWRSTDADPIELLNYVANGGMITAHNAAFERTIWNVVIRRERPHWPIMQIAQQDCTLARAAAVAHPQGLDALGNAMQLDNRKDAEGHNLMMKMSKPRRHDGNGPVWWDAPQDIDRLMKYCRQDVVVETEADAKLPPLTDAEREVWKFDQLINERGIHIDLNAVQKAATLVEYAKKQADSEMRRLTSRVVPRCSNDGKIVEWLQARGLDFTSVRKDQQEDIIYVAGLNNDHLVREVIELRGASKKTSTAKYKAMLTCVCADSRIRGLLAYHGAAPGRWAGRLVQPQNFPRLDYKKEGHIIEWLHELLADDALTTKDVYDMLVVVHGADAPLRILSRALRSMIKAGPGNKLIGGDFANIEGRVNAWFADEAWKLQAFRDYDGGTGPDLYNLAYSKSFGVPIASIGTTERQIGKVQELALGYQGGVGAYLDMGPTYGLSPYDLSGPVQDATPAHRWDATADLYAKAKDKNGLQEREWTAIKILVDGFRAANPRIVQSWWNYQDAAIEAVSAPGEVIAVANGRVSYYCDGRCLWCVLPSGRMLCYASPTIKAEWVEYTDKITGETKERLKRSVHFWGMDSETNRWKEKSLYGGLQCENIVQGTARCIMVDRMFAVERAGYPIILTVHDEIVAEPPGNRPELNDKDFEKIMSVLPAWAAGLPLAAKAWEDQRYIK